MRITWNAPVTLAVAGASVAVFLLMVLVPAAQGWFVLRIPQWSALSLGNAVTLVTNVLGHAGFAHLAGNLMLFLLVAPACEERFGSARFALMIVLTALVISFVHITLSDTGLLGLSGVVFMTMLAGSATNIRSGQVPLTLILVAAIYLGREVVGAFHADGISQLAHLTGGLCGIVFGLNRTA